MISAHGDLKTIGAGGGVFRLGSGGRARRHVVMPPVAIGASDALVRRAPKPASAIRPHRRSVRGSGGRLRPSRGGIGSLEAENQARLLAPRFDVPAGRPVARFAVVAPVNVLRETLGVSSVARGAKFVVVNVFGVRHSGERGLHRRIRHLLEKRIAFGQPGSKFVSVRWGDSWDDLQEAKVKVKSPARQSKKWPSTAVSEIISRNARS